MERVTVSTGCVQAPSTDTASATMNNLRALLNMNHQSFQVLALRMRGRDRVIDVSVKLSQDSGLSTGPETCLGHDLLEKQSDPLPRNTKRRKQGLPMTPSSDTAGTGSCSP